MFSQNSGELPKRRDNRNAIEGVIARRSLKISLMVCRDTPKADANDVAFRPKSGMKSSLRISPGCVGEICLFPVLGMLILVSLNGNRLFRHHMHHFR